MSAPSTTRAVRPRNRKQLILDAAGRVFSERGYHAASMEEIAARVDITAAALYRHFPNKYALFAQCTFGMVDRLVEILDDVGADASLAETCQALAELTVADRASGGVYRWEARYLEAEERAVLRAKFAIVVDAVHAAVQREHPGPDSRLRAVAALGAIGSITAHHTSIAQRRAEELLVAAALRVAAAESASVEHPAVVLPAQPVARSRRAEILQAAIPLFEQDGFANVTMGRIAESVGLATSALYRHYPAKVDIMAAACLQAAGLLGQAVESALRVGGAPRASLELLAATYVAYSFEFRSLTSVAEAEVVGLPADLQRPVVAAQREHVAVWAEQLVAVQPELDGRTARTLVHAALGVVVEGGRLMRWEDSPANRAALSGLMVEALGL